MLARYYKAHACLVFNCESETCVNRRECTLLNSSKNGACACKESIDLKK